MADTNITTPVAAGAANANAHPDAELIAICDRLAFVQAEAIRRGDAVTDESDEAYGEVVHPLWAERDRLLDAIEPLRAQTSDGISARVRALAAANPVDDHGHHWFSFDGGRVVSGQLSWLLRDTAALDTSGNIVWKPPAADAELITACAEFDRLEMAYVGLYHGPGRIDDDKARDAADKAAGRRDKQEPLLDVITSTPAMTLEALRAKARSAVTWDFELLKHPSSSAEEILASLLHDLVGEYDPVAIARGKAA